MNKVIYLKAGGSLHRWLKPDLDPYTRRVEVNREDSLEEILAKIGIPPSQVALFHSAGRIRTGDYVPSDGEIITLQPPVAGG